MWMRSTSEWLPSGWLLVGQQYAWRGPEGGLEKRKRYHTNPCPGFGVNAEAGQDWRLPRKIRYLFGLSIPISLETM
jgi:hypothetical protein